MVLLIITTFAFCSVIKLAFSAGGPPDRFTCDFNDADTCSMMQARNDAFNWAFARGSTPTHGTGPGRDHGEGTRGYYIYIETDNPRIVNDYARLLSGFLAPGDYNMKFHYHAVGQNIGLLNVYTKIENSDYHRLIWFYTPKLNVTSHVWQQQKISVTETAIFQFVFEGVVGDGSLGDIALDDISAIRIGPASEHQQPEIQSLPISCDFEMNSFCPLVSYYGSQVNWLPSKGKTESKSAGPSKDHTIGTEQGTYVYAQLPGARPGSLATLVTPMFLPPCGCFIVEFWYHAYGSSAKKMMLKQEGYDTLLWETNSINRNQWINVKKNFTATHPSRLLFIGVMGDTHTSGYGLDDISIQSCGCPPTTTTTTTTQTTTQKSPETTSTTTTELPTTTSPLTTTTTLLTTTTTPMTSFPPTELPEGLICNFNNGDFCTLIQQTDDVFNWTIQQGDTQSKRTGPDRDHGWGVEGYYVYIEASEPQKINDYARISSEVFEAGSWTLKFHYHVFGDHIGGLNVYTKAYESDFHRLIWYYRAGINSTISDWTEAIVSIVEASNFHVVFEGVVGDGPQGDIALDDIIAINVGPAANPVASKPFGLPIACEFEENSLCLLANKHHFAQMNWTLNIGRGLGDGSELLVDRTQGAYIFINDFQSAPGWRGIITTPQFWSTSGCVSVNFWYFLNGKLENGLRLTQEGYDAPLWVVNITVQRRWTRVQQKFTPTHPTKECHPGFESQLGLCICLTSPSVLLVNFQHVLTLLLFIGEIADTHPSEYALDDILIEDCVFDSLNKTFQAAKNINRTSSADSITTPTDTVSTLLSTTANTQTASASAKSPTKTTVQNSPAVVAGEALGHSTCLLSLNYLLLVTSILVSQLNGR